MLVLLNIIQFFTCPVFIMLIFCCAEILACPVTASLSCPCDYIFCRFLAMPDSQHVKLLSCLVLVLLSSYHVLVFFCIFIPNLFVGFYPRSFLAQFISPMLSPFPEDLILSNYFNVQLFFWEVLEMFYCCRAQFLLSLVLFLSSFLIRHVLAMLHLITTSSYTVKISPCLIFVKPSCVKL